MFMLLLRSTYSCLTLFRNRNIYQGQVIRLIRLKLGYSTCSARGNFLFLFFPFVSSRSTVFYFKISKKRFYYSRKNMSTGNLLSGRDVSKAVQKELQDEIKDLKAKHPDFDPLLAIVQVGGREDSNVYIRMKKKVASEVGVSTRHIQLPRTVTQEEILSQVQKLNEDATVHGIIVQLPLDTETTVNANLITNAVAPNKDVDGISDVNAGKLSHGELEGYFIACTPMGCLELIKRSGVTIKGSKAVVIGRSKIVGLPMSLLLLWQHATVTICHSRTKDLKSVCQDADIIVAAVGQAKMVKKDWVKPGAVVIDCGINSIKDESRASGSRLVGDVDFEEVKDVASYITPVPGGVGPMTVIMLVKNTLLAAKNAL